MSEDDYVGTLEFEFRNIIVNKLMRFTNWEKGESSAGCVGKGG